jgi:hypothetical protein
VASLRLNRVSVGVRVGVRVRVRVKDIRVGVSLHLRVVTLLGVQALPPTPRYHMGGLVIGEKPCTQI